MVFKSRNYANTNIINLISLIQCSSRYRVSSLRVNNEAKQNRFQFVCLLIKYSTSYLIDRTQEMKQILQGTLSVSAGNSPRCYNCITLERRIALSRLRDARARKATVNAMCPPSKIDSRLSTLHDALHIVNVTILQLFRFLDFISSSSTRLLFIPGPLFPNGERSLNKFAWICISMRFH